MLQQFLSESDREKQTHNRDLIMQNRRLTMSHQVGMAFQKGQLTINGDVFEKAITPPSNKKILLAEKISPMEEVGLHKTAVKTVNGSSFYAYTRQVKSLEEIKDLYEVVRAEHLSATHIMCGYRIFGAKFCELQNYSDDGEISGGKAILNVLKDLKIWNQVVFVARYHDGPNLGKRHFSLIAEATKEIIASYPNPINYGQSFGDQILKKALDKAATKPTRKSAPPKQTPGTDETEQSQEKDENDESDDEQSQDA